MAKVISLWSGPRNISTALMYSFSRRSDISVVDEPLYAYYLVRTKVRHPGREEVIASMEKDPKKIWANCDALSNNRHVFLKNMAHHAIDLPEEWYRDATPLFLIRDPREMIPSLAKVLQNPVLRDTGLDRQVEIVRKIQQHDLEILVVEGADILRNPAPMLGKVCERLGIPYESSMLSWPAGPIPEDGVWAKYWYDQVHKSTGFKAWQPPSRNVPERLQPLLEECMPYYLELKSLKIT